MLQGDRQYPETVRETTGADGASSRPNSCTLWPRQAPPDTDSAPQSASTSPFATALSGSPGAPRPMQIEFTRSPDSLLTAMLHKWLSAPQATLEMLRAIELGAESAPLQPAVSAAAAPAAPGTRATYPLGSSQRHGPCSHGPLRHREVPAGAGVRR
jgi:hypothetical protein